MKGSRFFFARAVLACAWLVSCAAVAHAAQSTYLLVITGVEGDQEHGELFQKWATTLIDAAKARYGVPDEQILYLAEHPERAPSRIWARSTRENVERAFARLGDRAGANDQVFVVLIGHGSFDGQQAFFNLPGPDLAATDYARLVEKLRAGRVIFVDTSSASGGFLKALAAPGRTVVTATRTGGERNETRFPAYFVEAFASTAADADQDGRVSVLEAFNYARTKVVQAYERDGLLLTEHATLDDGTDGKLAAAESLASDQAASAALAGVADPALRTLLEEQHALDEQISALKLRKDGMEPAAYQEELEKLLTDLALKTRAIRQLEEKK